MAKKPSNKKPTGPRRTRGKSAGATESRKTRPQVPSRNANKSASGKQVNAPR